MAYDGWIEFGGVELVNLSRTAQLAAALGVDTVWTQPEQVQWIEDSLGGTGYDNVANAPWYSSGHPASGEFIGIVPLGMPGLDDSTLTASTTEYITDGGKSGKARNTTLNIVASVAIVASTDRGADYGKRWLDRTLRGNNAGTFCAGSDLSYFQFAGDDAPKAHRHDVRVTRGTSITRKRITDCSSTWIATFTLVAADPFEYGENQTIVTSIGGETATGPGIESQGSIVLMQESCPVYDYTPIYDPLYPALVASPTAPDFYPAGWDIVEGAVFERFWARLAPIDPTTLNVVPTILLNTDIEARMVRVSLWDSTADEETQCDPLFSVVVTYVPPAVDFTIDGERKASYVWDGVSEAVRRTDSLVYGPDAEPVDWASFNDPIGMLLTLDIFADSSGYEGDGEVRASLVLTPKSD